MIKPLHKFVLLKKVEEVNKTMSGIILTTEKKEADNIAQVVAIGSECQSGLKEYDQVIYKEYSGTNIEIENDNYIVIDEKDIIAKFG